MIRTALRLCLLAVALSSPVLSIPEDYETVRTSNAAILNRLGLMPLVLPDGHHRKRLAGPEAFGARDAAGARLHQSAYGRRHSGSPHDSHVYIVKLPASPPYYSFSKPHKINEHNVTVAKPNPGFKSNGKPDKIFHWNLPLVKKINEKKKHLALAKMEQAKRKLEAEKERLKVAEKMNYYKKLAQEQLVAETQRKPSRNNDKWLSDLEKLEPRIKSAAGNATQLKIVSSSSSNDKSYRLNEKEEEEEDERETSRSHHHDNYNNWRASNDVPQQQGKEHQQHQRASSHNALATLAEMQHMKKHRKKSAGVSYYYAPALTGKSASTSISKHFPGNGKPKAFYVMEKSRKPVYYHPLLP